MNLNAIFASNMVLPANKPIRIYGKGAGVAEIDFVGYKKSGEFHGEDWLIELPPMEYGGPYEMIITLNGEKTVLKDVYVGEVYLCAGQSNMQVRLRECSTPPESYESNDMLRLFSVDKSMITDKVEYLDRYTSKDGWVLADKKEVAEWSGLMYLFGTALSKKKKGIAIGIIACAIGSSIIESWLPKDTLKTLGIDIPLEEKTPAHSAEYCSNWNKDAVMYEKALSQVTPYSLNGVIWYQGESDSSDAESNVYLKELCALIEIWRKDFREETLPFAVVQISDYTPERTGWQNIQKAQLEASKILSNVTTVISADVCEKREIHPPTKDKLAERIVDIVLKWS